MLRCIQRQETDPYYNLAAEEFLFTNAAQNTFMVWRNEPSIIIGKHQNAAREINHAYTSKHNIPVIRRISGGGAVYHDPGNLNFSFIYIDRKENPIDFVFFTKPIISFLRKLGLNAEFSGKNSIGVDGLKVSGNSAHVHKKKVLHHGTLLFDTDLTALNNAISSNEDLYDDRAIKSVRSPVVNILNMLKEDITIQEFTESLIRHIKSIFPGFYQDTLNVRDNIAIMNLVKDKYSKDSWNFDYSPDYKFNTKWRMNNNNWEIGLMVKQGKILQASLVGPSDYASILQEISTRLTGISHHRKAMMDLLDKTDSKDRKHKKVMNLIIDKMF
jgi:lipoate-protein ligase A